MDYSPWGRKELGTTEWLSHTLIPQQLKESLVCLRYSASICQMDKYKNEWKKKTHLDVLVFQFSFVV